MCRLKVGETDWGNQLMDNDHDEAFTYDPTKISRTWGSVTDPKIS